MLSLPGLSAPAAFGAEALTLDQAVATALTNNHGMKAADAQVEAADAGRLKANSGFLPKVTLSETWSKSDNPLMVLGTKLNQEIITAADFDPTVMNDPAALANYNSKLAVAQPIVLDPGGFLSTTLGSDARIRYVAVGRPRP